MKNKTKKRVGIVAVMLMLVVAIGAAAGNTLAKYIYSASVNDTATVAKWGFTVTANTTDLFSEQYNANKIVSANADTVDVKAEANKVVAPGTSNATEDSGEMIITINGYAEVDAQLVIDITEFETVWLDQAVESVAKVGGVATTAENNTLGEGKYYPIQWTFKADDNTAVIDLTSDSYDSLAEALAGELASNLGYEGVLPEDVEVNEEASTGTSIVIDIPAGTTFNSFKLTIGWKWLFQQEKTAAEGTENQEGYKPATYYDVEDTILGALAAGEADYLYTSADDGDTITEIDMSKYDNPETQYNLSVKLGLKAKLVQTTNAE